MSRSHHRRHRLQVAQRLLAEHGLIASGRSSADQGLPASTRLAGVLQRLGPVLSSFGAYLGTRVDLLPFHDCLELAALRDLNGPTPADAVRNLLATELGATPVELFSVFEEQPVQHGLLFQWHTAQLHDGSEVLLKILRPEVEARLAADLEVLPLLQDLRLDGHNLPGPDLDGVVDDFRELLERQLDLESEAANLNELAAKAAGFDALVVPRLHDQLCTPRVLSLARPLGQTVRRYLPESQKQGRDGCETGSDPDDAQERGELARRLCLAWLQQSLLEPICLEGPLADHLLVLDDHRFEITGGLLVKTSAESRHQLLDYLVAARRHEPDQACACLLRETSGGRKTIGEEQLRLRLRQAEPFRAGGWSDHFAGQRLADTLYVHWRLCREGGYRPTPTLLSFLRGLFDLELTARRLAPERDALVEGLDDLRVVAAAVRLREAVGPKSIRRSAEQLLPVLEGLRARIDDIGHGIVLGSRQADRDRADEDSGRDDAPSGRWAGAGGLLLVLLVIVVVVNRLPLAGVNSALVGRAGAVAFAGVAALLLWYLNRS